MMNVIVDEKRLMAEGKPGSDNLVSNLVRASEGNADSADMSTSSQSRLNKPLSIDEILGNIFVYNFAGHDTTAISLTYSMFLLVAHPEIQDWIAEELQYFLVDEQSEAWKYGDVFPKLKRSLAVLVRMRVRKPRLESSALHFLPLAESCGAKD
jgi:cytochrome P450